MSLERKKLCCRFQKLILECINTENYQEYFKSMEGWMRSGKVNENGNIKFDCSDCSEFYSEIIDLTGIDTNSKETNLEKVKEIGCCQSISIIKDLDDKVDISRLKVWLSIFKDIMCFDCLEVVKLASVEFFSKNN